MSLSAKIKLQRVFLIISTLFWIGITVAAFILFPLKIEGSLSTIQLIAGAAGIPFFVTQFFTWRFRKTFHRKLHDIYSEHLSYLKPEWILGNYHRLVEATWLNWHNFTERDNFFIEIKLNQFILIFPLYFKSKNCGIEVKTVYWKSGTKIGLFKVNGYFKYNFVDQIGDLTDIVKNITEIIENFQHYVNKSHIIDISELHRSRIMPKSVANYLITVY